MTVAASDGAATTRQAVAVTVPPNGAAIGEVVQLTVGTSWQTLSFANVYVDPVVFALAPSLNEADAAATRFRNVAGTGADIRLQEPKRVIDPDAGLQARNAGDHPPETVTLLVMERGVHTLEDGTVLQVGEINTNKLSGKGFETVAFAEDFAAAPSIFSQVQTYSGSDFIVSRQRNPDGTGFALTMQEDQADNRNHAREDVGWMAIAHGSGSLSTMDWQAGSSAPNVNGKLAPISFSAAFKDAPLVVASLASYNGAGFDLALQTLDGSAHAPESVSWMVVKAGSWQLSDGTILQAGLVDPGAGFASVAFGAGFADGPAVLTQTQTATDDAFVKTRMQGRGPGRVQGRAGGG